MAEENERVRKVRFHGRVQFKTIRHVADFSEEEIIAGWYRKKDFMRMSEEVSEIAQLVAQGKDRHNGEELWIRGLEHLVEEDVADYRAEKMIASIDAVLDEQDEQREEDANDPEVIAKIYSEIVTPLLREAYLVGLRDAQEAASAAAEIPDLIPQAAPISPPEPSQAMMDVDVEKEKPKEEKPKQENPKEEKPKVVPKLNLKRLPSKTEDNGDDFMTASSKEEFLNDVGKEEEKPSANKLKSNKEANKKGAKGAASSAANRKATAEERKNRIRFGGGGSELSPLVRRRDGTFAFRNKELDIARKELSKQRRDCVRDALFKYLDSPEPAVQRKQISR